MNEKLEMEEFERLLSGLSDSSATEASKLASLGRALDRMGSAARPALRPDFRDGLRAQLVAEARSNAVVIPLSMAARMRATVATRNARMRRSFRTVVGTAAAAMMMLVSGAALAGASGAKPGDALYWLDRAKERAELSAAFGNVDKAERHLSFARERLEEVRALSDAGSDESPLYVRALKDMDGSTVDATTLLVRTYRSDHDSGVLAPLVQFSLAQRQALERLEPALPPAARPKLRGSIELVVAVQNRVSDVLGGCPCPADVLTPATGGDAETPGTPACACQPKATNDDGTSEQADKPKTDQTPPTGGDKDDPQPPPPPPPSGPLPDVTGTGVESQVNQIVNGLLDQLGVPTPSASPLPGL